MKTTKKWGRRLKSRHHNRTAGERKEAHLWFLGVYLSGIVVSERESVKSSSSVLTQTVEAPQDAGLKGDAPHSWPHTHPHDHTHKHTLWKVKNPQTSLIPTLTAEPTHPHTHTHPHTPTHTPTADLLSQFQLWLWYVPHMYYVLFKPPLDEWVGSESKTTSLSSLSANWVIKNFWTNKTWFQKSKAKT